MNQNIKYRLHGNSSLIYIRYGEIRDAYESRMMVTENGIVL